MKKLLVGCLVILVLGVIVAVAGSYFLYRAASPMLQNAKNYLQGMAELGELDEQITNKSPYAAPANGELTPAQVDRFVRLQDSVRAARKSRGEDEDAEAASGSAGSGRTTTKSPATKSTAKKTAEKKTAAKKAAAKKTAAKKTTAKKTAAAKKTASRGGRRAG